ncbi:MAG: hypothetical protein A3C47_04605 [Omnitrophica bacterium RIFCSPHIGHO2_02_FULL_51_18]|nr:MAG: hypothetical protein A3C47_04605 [Omnitrophica bacterium RIFCSPHIGHO2_02_FULL_51_18]
MKKKSGHAAVLIDARPCFGAAVAALLPLNGAALLERHLRLARNLGAKEIVILEEHGTVSKAMPELAQSGVRFCLTEPAGEFLLLSTKYLYKEKSAKIIWTLRGADDLKNAQGEIERAEFFTISKHTLRPMGKLFAHWLYAHTPVTANHLTLSRIAVGLAGAYYFFQGTFAGNVIAGACVLFSWFFDLTDGQLARLRGEVSKFGAYLDSVGDGVVDNFYYMAIAAALYRQTSSEAYLILGAGFMFGKYVFVNSTLLAPMVLEKQKAAMGSVKPPVLSPLRAFIKAVISKSDETDIRIHLLALLAVMNAPVAALVFHVVYFNARWLMNLANAFYKYELKKETT